MSAESQYINLLTKVASGNPEQDISVAYNYCLGKTAALADNLLWAAGGALPAYLVGQSMAKEKERAKHKNYALAGAAAGFLAPKLLSAIVDPTSVVPSASGFDAQDIIDLQLDSID